MNKPKVTPTKAPKQSAKQLIAAQKRQDRIDFYIRYRRDVRNQFARHGRSTGLGALHNLIRTDARDIQFIYSKRATPYITRQDYNRVVNAPSATQANVIFNSSLVFPPTDAIQLNQSTVTAANQFFNHSVGVDGVNLSIFGNSRFGSRCIEDMDGETAAEFISSNYSQEDNRAPLMRSAMTIMGNDPHFSGSVKASARAIMKLKYDHARDMTCINQLEAEILTHP
jgi:hypothetical protein